MKKTNASQRKGVAAVRSKDGFCGVELIAAERKRQISKEGWTPKHDDEHGDRELASAALSYVGHYVARAWTYTNELGAPGIVDGPATYCGEEPHDAWPWEESDWNPQNPERDLVKAGALIAAELDRLQRAKSKPQNVRMSDEPNNQAI